MKAYTTLPRIVMAAIIVAVHAAGSEASPGNMAMLELDDGSKFSADGAMTIRHWPQPGDYLVKTENPDGSAYYYLNPKDVFEEKYTEVLEVAGVGAADPDPLPELNIELNALSPETVAAFTGLEAQPADAPVAEEAVS